MLIDYSLERSIEAFRRIGYGQIETLIDPYRQSGVLLQLEKGEVGPEALYDEISRSVGRPVDPKAIDAALCGFLLDIPDYKLDMLLDLRRRGFRLFMLSNTIMMTYMKNGVFRKQGLTIDAYFDRLFLSYEMGLVKPGAEIFRRMIESSGIVPSQTLFIDDSQANVDTGEGLRIRYLSGGPERRFPAVVRPHRAVGLMDGGKSALGKPKTANVDCPVGERSWIKDRYGRGIW